MLVKRYRAKNMQEAMDTVIKELGSDAVILNSRKVRRKGLRYIFQKPLQEIMVAYDPAKTPIAKKIYGTYGSGDSTGSGNAFTSYGYKPSVGERNDDRIRKAVEINKEQLTNLDKKIDTLDKMLTDFINNFSHIKRDITYDYPDDIEEFLINMINNQVRQELAHILAKEAEQITKRQQSDSAVDIMEHLILEELGSPAPILTKRYNRKIVLAVGPTGVGKTTTIVKLAANFTLKQKKKVGILNTDTYRIAAHEQLKTYSDILDVPLGIVYQPTEIGKSLEEMGDRDIIFIDTAGKSPGDIQHKEDIESLIKNACPDEILLCLSASTGFPALKEIIDTYSYIKDYKLIITKLDETRYRGMILNLCNYTKKSIAYVTTGQNVPDDIELIDTLSITRQLLRPL